MEGITVRSGVTNEPARFETYADILTRHGLDELTIEGESAPPGEMSSETMIVEAGRFIPYTAPSVGTRAHAGGYAAHFGLPRNRHAGAVVADLHREGARPRVFRCAWPLAGRRSRRISDTITARSITFSVCTVMPPTRDARQAGVTVRDVL